MDAVKKVEIIVSTLELPEIIDILETVRVSGYTVMNNTSGYGDRGISDDRLDKVFSNAYVLTVCTNDKQLAHLVDEVQPILKKVGGVCLVTDANWVSH
jgi:nitrogen regulatory protein PII